jgi:hypothetical protein
MQNCRSPSCDENGTTWFLCERGTAGTMSTMTALEEMMLEDFVGKLQEQGISDGLQEIIAIADAIEASLPLLSEIQLQELVTLLGSLQNWVPLHPGLARQMLTLGRSFGQVRGDAILDGLKAGMTPSHWPTAGGPSLELQQALFANRSAFQTETEPELKAAFLSAAGRIVAHFFAELESGEEDDD